MLKDSRFTSLEGLAIASLRGTPEESRGLCLHASVEFGRQARRLGMAGRLSFVRWHVRDDSDYLEHWALATANGRILDMTAAQVDGDPRPLRRVDDYPANYVRPRLYPAAVVLEVMDGNAPEPGHRYPRRLLWRLHARLFRHDAGAALRAGSPRALGHAVAAMARCAFALPAGFVLERALARAVTLSKRL
ncbi:MAG: hypothetical protein ABJD97_00455 [Betaproteobacteria bacterium]